MGPFSEKEQRGSKANQGCSLQAGSKHGFIFQLKCFLSIQHTSGLIRSGRWRMYGMQIEVLHPLEFLQ